VKAKKKKGALTGQQVQQLLSRGRGRPLLRDKWAEQVWDVLWSVHPQGLPPAEVRVRTGLNRGQVLMAARYLRDTFSDQPNPPVVYVRSENLWYIAPTWGQHTRQAIRSEYLQQSAQRLLTAEKLLAQAERAFPAQARRIRKVKRNATYLREETEDLVQELIG
jgi:hypothetical protein